MRRLSVLLGMALVLAVAGPVSAQEGTGTVTVIHGVPDLTVDVYVNGDLTLDGFEPGTVTDPLELPAGDYDIEIYAAGADPDVDDAAITGSASLPAGANATIIAHLTEGGDPTLGVFVNDTSTIAAGEARLTVRHTAAAPGVDVRAGGEPVFTSLTNPNEDSADLPAGDVSADVVLAGTDDVVIGPADLSLEAGTAYFVYAWGSADDGNLGLLVQTISGLGAPAADAPPVDDAVPAPPTAVPSGSGGLASDASVPTWLVLAAGLAALAAVGGSVRLARARR